MATFAPPIEDPNLDLYANQAARLKATNIVFIILPTIFVALRLASRKIARVGYWWDDLLILLALIISYGLPVSILVSVERYGFGRHIYILPLDATPRFLKILYGFEILFYVAAACNKLSILAFYRRIFPIAQLRIALLITTAVVLAFTFSCLVVVLLQCIPIHAFWDIEQRPYARCVNVDRLFLSSGGINCFLDVFIVILPIPLLWRLRTTQSQKLVLTSIFSVAGFVCLVSIIRLVVLSRLTETDLTWNYVNAAIWTACEPSMGVVSACLPSLRPLFKKLFIGTYRGPTFRSKSVKTSQNYSTETSSKNAWSQPRNQVDDLRGMHNFSKIEEPTAEPHESWGHNVRVHGGHYTRARDPETASVEDIRTSPRRIKVRTEVTLISTDRLEYRDQLF